MFWLIYKLFSEKNKYNLLFSIIRKKEKRLFGSVGQCINHFEINWSIPQSKFAEIWEFQVEKKIEKWKNKVLHMYKTVFNVDLTFSLDFKDQGSHKFS